LKADGQPQLASISLSVFARNSVTTFGGISERPITAQAIAKAVNAAASPFIDGIEGIVFSLLEFIFPAIKNLSHGVMMPSGRFARAKDLVDHAIREAFCALSTLSQT
jgi:hypothetical protein